MHMINETHLGFIYHPEMPLEIFFFFDSKTKLLTSILPIILFFPFIVYVLWNTFS
jgi:hypothetical protein